MEISIYLPAVWPDLVKFHHFAKILRVVGKILKVYLVFGKIMKLLWQILNAIGLIFIAVNEQILKNNLAIWSHCLPGPKNIPHYTATTVPMTHATPPQTSMVVTNALVFLIFLMSIKVAQKWFY